MKTTEEKLQTLFEKLQRTIKEWGREKDSHKDDLLPISKMYAAGALKAYEGMRDYLLVEKLTGRAE